MQRRTLVTAGAATLAFPSLLLAQNLPTGPVRIIVGFAPGGGTDILARVIGQKLGEMWKTQVIVENRAGASGTIAADYVAKQPGDGATLLMAHINSQAITPALQKVSYDPAKDFQPVVLVGVTPNLLICNENQPAKTVKDLVELCRANPGKVSFGSAGTGSAQHLALEMFKLAAKVDAIHVPYKGSGPMLTDLIGGQVMMFTADFAVMLPQIKGGKIRGLAVTSSKRSPAIPELPTVNESLGLKDYELIAYFAMFAPAGTPPDIVAKLNLAINAAAQSKDIQEKFSAIGFAVEPGTPEALAQRSTLETAKWAKAIRDAKIEPQ